VSLPQLHSTLGFGRLFSFSLMCLLIASLAAGCGRSDSPPGANPLKSCAAPNIGASSTYTPAGGAPGLVAHYGPSVTENEAKKFEQESVQLQGAMCEHRAFVGSVWTRRELTVYFRLGATSLDREEMAEFLTNSGMFDAVEMIE
jgi:hypothetical protein